MGGARQLIENYYNKMTNDFHLNKKILSDVATVPTKRLRNKIAGFATHLMQRIQVGPVKGISLKIQEKKEKEDLISFQNIQLLISKELPKLTKRLWICSRMLDQILLIC